jgi:hypothetical protein
MKPNTYADNQADKQTCKGETEDDANANEKNRDLANDPETQ